MAGMLRVPMRRGDLTGVLLVLLGAWGALIAFIGRGDRAAADCRY